MKNYIRIPLAILIATAAMGVGCLFICVTIVVFNAKQLSEKTLPLDKLLAREVPSTDVSIDKAGNVRYKGKLVGRMKEDRPPPVKFKKGDLPQGSDSAEQLNLGDGRWLVSGGEVGESNQFVATNYLYSDKTGKFVRVAPLVHPRASHSLFKMEDGRILIFGGTCTQLYEHNVELLDLEKNSCSTIGSASYGRMFSSLFEFGDGRVFAMGGVGEVPNRNVDMVTIDGQRSSCVVAAHLNKPRDDSSLFQISDTEYLVVGGLYTESDDQNSTPPPELFLVPLPPNQLDKLPIM